MCLFGVFFALLQPQKLQFVNCKWKNWRSHVLCQIKRFPGALNKPITMLIGYMVWTYTTLISILCETPERRYPSTLFKENYVLFLLVFWLWQCFHQRLLMLFLSQLLLLNLLMMVTCGSLLSALVSQVLFYVPCFLSLPACRSVTVISSHWYNVSVGFSGWCRPSWSSRSCK